MSQELAQIETTAIEPEMSLEQVAAVWNKLDTMKAAIRDLERRIEQGMFDWVHQHGSTTIGDTRYYIAPKRQTKCHDVAGTLGALLNACAGDVDALAHSLAAQPFKHGTCKQVLPPQDFYRLFTTTEEPELKLQRIDTRFTGRKELPDKQQNSTSATHEPATTTLSQGQVP